MGRRYENSSSLLDKQPNFIFYLLNLSMKLAFILNRVPKLFITDPSDSGQSLIFPSRREFWIIRDLSHIPNSSFTSFVIAGTNNNVPS